MSGKLTFFWTATTAAEESRLLREAAVLYHAELKALSPGEVAQYALSALAQGPVIAVVETNRQAADMLGLGVDETVRAGRITIQGLHEAIARARARAAMRVDGRDSDDDPGYSGAALGLLGSALDRQVRDPLAQAITVCGRISDELAKLVGYGDTFIERVRSTEDGAAVRQLTPEIKAYARTSVEIEKLVDEVQRLIERSERLVRTMGDLADDGALPDPQADVAEVVRLIQELLRGDLDGWVRMEASCEETCRAKIPRMALVCIVSGLVQNALESVRREHRDDSQILLRVFAKERTIGLEIADNGAPVASDLRAGPLESLLGSTGGSRLRLLRERVRGFGGELFVDSDASGTVVTVYFNAYFDASDVVPAGLSADRVNILRPGANRRD